MEWEIIGPMVVALVFIVTVGGVVLLRPVAKRFGALMDRMPPGSTASSQPEHRRLSDAIETMNERISLLEERQDFAERLIDEQSRRPGEREA